MADGSVTSISRGGEPWSMPIVGTSAGQLTPAGPTPGPAVTGAVDLDSAAKRVVAEGEYSQRTLQSGGKRTLPLEAARAFATDRELLASCAGAYEAYLTEVEQGEAQVRRFEEAMKATTWLMGITWRHTPWAGQVPEVGWDGERRIDAANLKREDLEKLNELLVGLPEACTGGYQIPKERAEPVYFFYEQVKNPDQRVFQPNYAMVPNRQREQAWSAAVEAVKGVRSKLEGIGVALRQHVDARRGQALAKIRDLETQLEGRLQTGLDRLQDTLTAERRRLDAFLQEATLDKKVDLAEKTRIQLAAMINATGFRREPTLRATTDASYRREAATTGVTDTKGLSAGLSFGNGSFGLTLGFTWSEARSWNSEQESFEYHHRAAADEIVPGTSQFDVVVWSPLHSSIERLDPQNVKGVAVGIAKDMAMTRLQARVIVEKALVLKEIADDIASNQGGKALATELRQWLSTQLSFWTVDGVKLGDVVLSDVNNDAMDLEAAAAARGMPILGPSRLHDLEEGKRDAFARAFENPTGLPRAEG